MSFVLAQSHLSDSHCLHSTFHRVHENIAFWDAMGSCLCNIPDALICMYIHASLKHLRKSVSFVGEHDCVHIFAWMFSRRQGLNAEVWGLPLLLSVVFTESGSLINPAFANLTGVASQLSPQISLFATWVLWLQACKGNVSRVWVLILVLVHLIYWASSHSPALKSLNNFSLALVSFLVARASECCLHHPSDIFSKIICSCMSNKNHTIYKLSHILIAFSE